jgi:hypothetical protein
LDSGFDAVWLDPPTGNPRNRAVEYYRLGSILPSGRNFNFAVPMYSLGGRGLGASLTLYYNSKVWSTNGSTIVFNPVQGWPFAGFSLGFGRIFTYGSGSTTKYVLIDPDGTRHYLGTGSETSSTTYTTNDGSHVTFTGSKANGGWLYFNDGTQVAISVVNNRLLPTEIKDTNGNYVAVTYKQYDTTNFPWVQAIDYITDTVGRVIEFEYDSCDRLVLIKVPKFDDTNPRELVRFDYSAMSVSNSFSGLTVSNRPSGNVSALNHVYFPDTNTGYKFDYSVYGMIYNLSLRKGMSYNGGTQVITDGTERAAVSFNYPTTASSLTSAPTFSQRTETATNAPSATYSYATSSGSGTETYTITRPDS